MSRTYRCRHLPIHASGGRWWSTNARKIVDGGGPSWSRRRDIIEVETEKLLGPKPDLRSRMVKAKGLYHTEYTPASFKSLISDIFFPAKRTQRPGRWMKTWEAFEWERIADLIAADYIWPVASKHAWQRYIAGMGIKWYRDQANRWSRRRTRQILHSQIVDDDWEGHLPGRRDYFDLWDLY